MNEARVINCFLFQRTNDLDLSPNSAQNIFLREGKKGLVEDVVMRRITEFSWNLEVHRGDKDGGVRFFFELAVSDYQCHFPVHSALRQHCSYLAYRGLQRALANPPELRPCASDANAHVRACVRWQLNRCSAGGVLAWATSTAANVHRSTKATGVIAE